MLARITACAFFVFVAGQSEALQDCGRITPVVSAAKSDFASWDTPISSDLCTFSQNPTGTRTLTCYSDYSYREPTARSQFLEAAALILSCYPNAKETQPQTGVNHPDTYDQRIFDLGDVEISLSIKDKSELQKTYVFISFTGPGPAQ